MTTIISEVLGSRENFSSTWLTESPEGIGTFELVDTIVYNIRDRIKHDPTSVVTLGNGWKKLEGTQVVYYWFEEDRSITLAAEFEKAPQALVVRGVGKLKKGRPPFASDLYNLVLQDRKQLAGEIDAIRIMSDTQLSDEGFELWSRLLSQGHKLMVYDKQKPGQSYQGITTQDELAKFFKTDDRSFQRYQYVIVESVHYGEVRSHFNTRRMRELAGTL